MSNISMDVRVYCNGAEITPWVINYNREHKICTGIGTLELALSLDSGLTFNPWDEIDIEEGNVDTPTYYVTTVSTTHGTNAMLVLTCQDNSKRLVDFFVTDTYTVKVLEGTKKWITFFMELAGVNVVYQGAGAGGKVIPGTTLGMTSAYDQIVRLLQQSGWYMKFRKNGDAVVGQMQNPTHRIEHKFRANYDILSFGMNKNDKMLRNRAVVWGGVDPETLELIRVDKRKFTPWNYDRRDLRATALGNSTIPDRATAVEIADTLLDEFAHLTVEKLIDAPGSYDLELGDFVGVETTEWSGRGQITTYTVNMSKDGLITSLVLDERCPRLFAFWYPYDLGFDEEFVYIGTYGDGVWRKPFGSTEWQDFSYGISDKKIVDLHIKDSVAVCVDSTGNAYRGFTYDPSWTKLQISNGYLETASGLFYGQLGEEIKTRACIIDKTSNNIKLLADTYSGVNLQSYFALSSGILSTSLSGEFNAWILEYNGLGSLIDSFQISVSGVSASGNYNVIGFDIDNTGLNDVASVGVLTSGISLGPYADMGISIGGFNATNKDLRGITDMSEEYDYLANNVWTITTINRDLRIQAGTIDFPSKIFAQDNPTDGVKEIVTRSELRSHLIKYTPSQLLGYDTFSTTVLESPSDTSDYNVMAIVRIDGSTYREFINMSTYVAYRDWNTVANTLGAVTPLYNPGDIQIGDRSWVVLDGVIHVFTHANWASANSQADFKHIEINTDDSTITDRGFILQKSGWDARSYNGISFGTDGKAFLSNGIPGFFTTYYQRVGSTDSIRYLKYYNNSSEDAAGFSYTYTNPPTTPQRLRTKIQYNDYWYSLEGTYIINDGGFHSEHLWITPTSLNTQTSAIAVNSLIDDFLTGYSNYQPCANNVNRMVAKRDSDGSWGFFNNNNVFTAFTINDVRFTQLRGIFPTFGTYTGDVFVLALGTTTGGFSDPFTGNHILSCDTDGNVNNVMIVPTYTGALADQLYNSLSFFVLGFPAASVRHQVATFPNVVTYGGGVNPTVIKRDGENFHIIESDSINPDRVGADIISYVATGEEEITSLNAYDVIGSGIERFFTGLTLGTLGFTGDLHDFRVVPFRNVSTESAADLLLFTVGSGINYLNLHYPIPILTPFMIFSGYLLSGLLLEMMEATNTFYPYQYIFASFSGGFLQQDPYSDIFHEDVDNLPSSRITIIRTDDSI